MKHFKISRHIQFESIPRFFSLAVAMLLAGTFSVMPAALAQTIDSHDPGNVAVYAPDSTDFDTLCDPVATCSTSDDLANNRVGNFVVTSGVTMSDLARSTMTKQFTIPTTTDSDIVLDARVTGSTIWRGSLYVVDFTKIDNLTIPSLGVKSEAFIRAGLVDVTDQTVDADGNFTNHFEVGNAAVADFGCEPDRGVEIKISLPLVSDPVELGAEVGWCEEDSSDTFSFGAKVITGHTYELQMTLFCQATTGFPLALLSACTFNPSPLAFDLVNIIENSSGALSFTIPGLTIDFGAPLGEVELFPDTPINFTDALAGIADFFVPSIDDGFLEWDYMTVTIDEDVPTLVRSGVSEALRLLHTPSGNRETSGLVLYPILCSDGDCNWPERP